MQTTVNGLTPDVLGACAQFEERQIGAERFNLFMGCPTATTATLILRGGAEQQGHTEGALHDGKYVCKPTARSAHSGEDRPTARRKPCSSGSRIKLTHALALRIQTHSHTLGLEP